MQERAAVTAIRFSLTSPPISATHARVREYEKINSWAEPDRSEEVLERHLLNVSKGLQANITAQLFALDAYP